MGKKNSKDIIIEQLKNRIIVLEEKLNKADKNSRLKSAIERYYTYRHEEGFKQEYVTNELDQYLELIEVLKQKENSEEEIDAVNFKIEGCLRRIDKIGY
ncbi:MAG: hypothetical protein GY870_04300 [archaeon]|nr:hypothetical protein [archaeon]